MLRNVVFTWRIVCGHASGLVNILVARRFALGDNYTCPGLCPGRILGLFFKFVFIFFGKRFILSDSYRNN